MMLLALCLLLITRRSFSSLRTYSATFLLDTMITNLWSLSSTVCDRGLVSEQSLKHRFYWISVKMGTGRSAPESIRPGSIRPKGGHSAPGPGSFSPKLCRPRVSRLVKKTSVVDVSLNRRSYGNWWAGRRLHCLDCCGSVVTPAPSKVDQLLQLQLQRQAQEQERHGRLEWRCCRRERRAGLH